MRRILVIDDDLHTRLAIDIWLKQCGVQGRDYGWRRERPRRAERGHVRSDDRRRLHAEHARFRVDQGISQPRADRPADCDLRLRFFHSRDGRSRLLQDGARPRRDAVPAQAVPAGDAARRDRRVPVGSRTASKTCRSTRRHCERAAEYFKREGKCGLKLRGRGHAAFVDEAAEAAGTSHQTRKNQTAPRRLRWRNDWIEIILSASGGLT